MDFGVVLGSKLEPKSTKNRSKRVPKTRSQFECILDGSWVPLGPILEAKMGPNWFQNRSKRGSEAMSKSNQKNDRNLDLQAHAGGRWKSSLGSLKDCQSQGPRDKARCARRTPEHSNSCLGAQWRIYIYIGLQQDSVPNCCCPNSSATICDSGGRGSRS